MIRSIPLGSIYCVCVITLVQCVQDVERHIRLYAGAGTKVTTKGCVTRQREAPAGRGDLPGTDVSPLALGALLVTDAIFSGYMFRNFQK